MSEARRRVRIQWTTTALECLKKLPPKVRRGLVEKADALCECSDPELPHKPLTGPLQGYCRITYGRYRAVYTVDDDELASGDVLTTIKVTFIAAGKRAEHSKDDVYKVAQRLVEMGIIDMDDEPKPEPRPPEAKGGGRPRRRRRGN